jgi:hypothetical protein
MRNRLHALVGLFTGSLEHLRHDPIVPQLPTDPDDSPPRHSPRSRNSMTPSPAPSMLSQKPGGISRTKFRKMNWKDQLNALRLPTDLESMSPFLTTCSQKWLTLEEYERKHARKPDPHPWRETTGDM